MQENWAGKVARSWKKSLVLTILKKLDMASYSCKVRKWVTGLLNHSQVCSKQINEKALFNKALQFAIFLNFYWNDTDFWFLDTRTKEFCHYLQKEHFKHNAILFWSRDGEENSFLSF